MGHACAMRITAAGNWTLCKSLTLKANSRQLRSPPYSAFTARACWQLTQSQCCSSLTPESSKGSIPAAVSWRCLNDCQDRPAVAVAAECATLRSLASKAASRTIPPPIASDFASRISESALFPREFDTCSTPRGVLHQTRPARITLQVQAAPHLGYRAVNCRCAITRESCATAERVGP